jgi:hypothetical protein
VNLINYISARLDTYIVVVDQAEDASGKVIKLVGKILLGVLFFLSSGYFLFHLFRYTIAAVTAGGPQ